MQNMLLRKDIIARAMATIFLVTSMAIALYLGIFP